MTDPQMITIGIATIVLFAGILFNNARIGDVHTRLTDLKEVLRAEARADRAETKSEIATLRAETGERLTRMEGKIDTLLKLRADMDARISHLEGSH